ncbi:chemotaxis protein CheW [Pseudomonas sp. RIT-PI-S]|uniref:chemotaxis protein CheW n=1 Tax=Pseudomonas sp. RIT-PI-S TaxID=3035295 RepID=UPI0021D95B55|nr:chemotaxis protein CheW [Pseudomonas sp. RIT-PI-S]
MASPPENGAVTPVGKPAGMLFLLFTLGEQRFALPARDIVEVLPLVPLKPIPHAPSWVGGVFAYRGQVVPVIDVRALALGAPAVRRTSTRVVLVSHAPGQTLGLVLEHASETLRCDPAQFKPYGLHNAQARYLGPIREDERGLLQWISVGELLDERARSLLYTPDNAGLLGGEGA